MITYLLEFYFFRNLRALLNILSEKNKAKSKISKKIEQKVAENRLQTPFKIQVGSQIARLRAIGKPNCQAKSCQAEGFWRLKKDLPQQLDVPAISKRKCKTYGALKYLVSNARDQLCEGAEEGKDNYGGDSGGPLFKRAE